MTRTLALGCDNGLWSSLAIGQITAGNRTHRLGVASCRRPPTPEPRPQLRRPGISYGRCGGPAFRRAVVTIRSARRVRAPQQFPFSSDSLLRHAFSGGPPSRMAPRSDGSAVRACAGIGSDCERRTETFLTNHHVRGRGPTTSQWKCPTGKTYSQKLVGFGSAQRPGRAGRIRCVESSDPVAGEIPTRVRVGDILPGRRQSAGDRRNRDRRGLSAPRADPPV